MPRAWNQEEEEEALNLWLTSLVNSGYWQLENKTFRPGYTRRLETLMAQTFPPHGIEEKYIAAKVKEWRNNYKLLEDMHGRPGFSWDQSEKRMIVECDYVWNEYVRVKPAAGNMRYMQFPYFDGWRFCFGRH